ncbi:MAG TPA: amidohydrolase [Bryobacteraceae bacterium]|nr:amidohydrolase [Bryobacteraceae bacterium]
MRALPFLFLAAAVSLPAQDLKTFVNSQVPGLVTIYKDLHAHPELSHQEAHTSALVADELRKAGYTVTERVGKYPDGTQAYGVVAVLENGPGPRLLIRSDLDALPVVEDTGLSYASHVRAKNAAGQDVGVMHACGHDIHMTTLIGTARTLAALKSQWHGTVMLIGQPSEETIDGAKAMLADHLYQRFGKPNMAIALHDTNLHPAGQISVTSGPALSGATSIDVTMRGIGSHGSRADLGKDPIVMAAQFITQIQTIASRQTDPRDPVVVTVGDIHAGTRRNIIPDEAKMELTLRAFDEKTREAAISGIRRAAQGVALAAGVPEDRAPIITVLENESTPVTYNDPALTSRIRTAIAGVLGAQNVIDDPLGMASEDFGLFGLDGRQIPAVMFWLGAMDPAKFAEASAAGKELPGPHSNHFEPLPEPTLRTGIEAMSAAAMALLKN